MRKIDKVLLYTLPMQLAIHQLAIQSAVSETLFFAFFAGSYRYKVQLPIQSAVSETLFLLFLQVQLPIQHAVTDTKCS